MNKIGPDGVVKSDIFNDFSLFSLNNITIGQYAAKIIQGSNNTILGNNAGLLAVDINNNIYLGFDAGNNIKSGNNSYIIGADNALEPIINNSINIGYNNISNSSITIGDNLTNDNEIVIGNNNAKFTLDEGKYELGQFIINDSINIGFNNYLTTNTIGNNNSNGNLIIGSSNSSLNSNALIIGDNIKDNIYSLNINNLICKYDDKIIYLGVGNYRNIPIVIGSTINDNNDPLLIQGGLNINKLTFKNNSNISITIKSNENSVIPNLIYYLPSLPTDINNYYLTVDKKGVLQWNEISKEMITTIITRGDLICNNIEADIIKGFGYFLINLNLNDKTTDNLNEGLTNFYLNNSRISSYFLSLVNNLNTNDIIVGSSNLYYEFNLYSSNFTNNINEITSDDLKEGTKRFYKLNDFNESSINRLTSITTDNIKIGIVNNYYTEENLNKYSNSFITNLREGNRNLYYTNERFQGVFTNLINSSNTNRFIEGSNNLYYNSFIVNSNLDNILSSITVDQIKEGRSNLYITSNRLNLLFNSNLQTTNQFIIGSCNLFFNNISNFEINSIQVREGNNRYYTNDCNIKDRITITTTTDNYSQGSSNTYLQEPIIMNQYDNYLKKSITTNDITERNNYKFIKNNFYNNNLNINGFIKTSNITDVPLDFTQLSMDTAELSIGHLTEVIHTYDYNTINLNSRLSNIELELNYDSNLNTNVPFIVIEDKIGINNINPRFNLHVGTGNNNAFFSEIQIGDENGINGDYGIKINSSFSNGHNLNIKTRNTSNGSFNDSLIITNEGNIGIGVSNPINKLQVGGNITASGQILSSFSDIRLKTKIDNLKNPLEIICKLNGFKYKLNEKATEYGFKDRNEMIGLNAQEVKEIIPEVVTIAPFDMDENEKGEIISSSGENYLSIQYERIIPYLIEAIKELKKENELLKSLIVK